MELRTNRVWELYSARERRLVQQHAQKSMLSPSQAVQMTQATGAVEVIVATVRATDGWCNGDCGIHHVPEMTENGLSYDKVTCPKAPPKVVPTMLVGTGGLCVESRMGGNLKLGGGRITEQHRQPCLVLMTNEMWTSQVCIFCYN
ncbi:hypothetical protein BGZ47_009932 [Haplosporangium gracile]|nr:hypothetical protein BGZ47_009932 [Haplosporangium gracile]